MVLWRECSTSLDVRQKSGHVGRVVEMSEGHAKIGEATMS